MNIPKTIIKSVKEQSGPFDNHFFYHAKSALNSINKVTDDTYCYDDISRAANVLERIYKGFLQTAIDTCEFYTLPSESFLNSDHDILGMVIEIKDNFPDVFPRQDRVDWRLTKQFLRDLRKEYSDSRYVSYPAYEDFVHLRNYINSQNELIINYIKEGNLEKYNENELNLDY